MRIEDHNSIYKGWIDIHPYKIINPLYYDCIESAISKIILDSIISNEYTITSQGRVGKFLSYVDTKKSDKYFNIGLKKFYENYEKVMKYYRNKRTDKVDIIDKLMESKSDLWTSKIPIYTKKINLVESMIELNDLLKNDNIEFIPNHLYEIQLISNDIWKSNFNSINSIKYNVKENIIL